MKNLSLCFLLLVLAIGQLFAQEAFRVQGHLRLDLDNNKYNNSTNRLRSEPDDYRDFTFDDIEFWVGNGTNRAALIIDWYDGKGTQTALVWGYRWHQDSVRTGFDMVKAIAKADKRFMLLTHKTNLGNTIAGLGYDLNNSGDISLILDGDTDNPYYPIDGMVTTTSYDYDSWKSNDPEDHWQAGWYSGYWSYQIKEAGEETFSYSGLGASSRILEDGSADGWGYQDFNSEGGFSGTLPRMPFVYVPSPYLPFPNYEAYWAHLRKDLVSHMPIVDVPLAIKKENLVEKWKKTGMSGGQPLIVNNNIYMASGSKLRIINRETGDVIKETTMSGSVGYFSMMGYGEGKIFVPLGNGVLQAFRADNLESIWKTAPVSGKQHLCEVTYHDGYVYTGMWQGGATGTFYCVKAEDEDPSDNMEIKSRVWESFNKGYYWSGGTIVDNVIVFGGDSGALESRDRLTGELLDSIQITGTIRCGTSFDQATRRIFFTAKEEQKVYSVKVNNDGTFDKTSLKSGKTNGQATTVPVLYNNRLYVSVGTMTSGGGLDVIDANTLERIYTAPTGISQATPLITTAYATPENNHTIYIYVTLNNSNNNNPNIGGNIYCVKDFEGNTEPIIQYSVVPSTKQYCTHSLLVDEQGTMYYKNDASVLIAYTNIPTYEVNSVALNVEEKDLKIGETFQLSATISPANATNKNVTWLSTNTDVATISSAGLVKALAEGETEIIVTTEDRSVTDTCYMKVEKMHYNNGVFFVNEDWFGHNNSTVNFLDENGNWHYRVYQRENPGKELGGTSQYGAVYGDKIFIVSKQDKDPGATVTGSRLAVCDVETMKSLAEFTTIGGADGRAFLGVDEHKGYISTSNGVYVFDTDNLSIGGQIKGTENGTGSLYTGQIGTMVRAADKVFAVNQQKGILVIDIKGDSVKSVIAAPKDGTKQRGFGSIVQSKDGNLWISVATNTSGSGGGEEYMLKLNPYTLDTTRVQLPSGASIPNSWYAWTADGFCASTQNNKLYWKNNGGWFNANKIYEYDIESNTTRTVIDFSTYESSKNWGIYGAGFRLDPMTDDIYVSLFKSFGEATYKVVKVSPTDGTVLEDYPMESNYWFPAMPVFTDKYAPVVSDELTNVLIKEETRIYLGDKVSDMDNLDAAIVKTVKSISNNDIIDAHIHNDSLVISPFMGQSGISDIVLQFNSNGKLVTKSITVTVEIEVKGVELNKHTLSIAPDETYQLLAKVLPEYATNKNVSWSSSNIAVATVNTDGLVTAIAAGQADITVITENGNFSDICTITVAPDIISVTSVTLNTKTQTLETNATYQLIATVLPENATNKNVSWSSSNPAIATVNANGLVTAVAAGEANITVTTEDGSLSDICSVTVNDPTIPVTSVVLDTNTLKLEPNTTHQFIATVLPSNATNKNVSWSSSNTAVATVDTDGLVTAIAIGQATITVTTEDGELSDNCLITVETVGVDSIDGNTLKVYPTVTTGQITIKQDNVISEIQIYSISGKLLETFNPQSSETSINISSYNTGLYLMKIGDQVIKVIKK